MVSIPSKGGRRARKRLFASERKRESIAAPPGVLDIDPLSPAPVIRVLAYGPTEVDERIVTSVETLKGLRGPVRWIDVVGLGDASVIEAIGKSYGIHPLALEDVVHQHQRPKVEVYGDSVFIVVHMPDTRDGLQFEQISIFVSAGVVVTFQEGASDCFDPVRERIRNAKGKHRTCGADYLAYSLVDAAIDHYFPHVDSVADRLDAIESEVVGTGGQKELEKLLAIKRTLLALRRYVRPLRDVLAHLQLETMPVIAPETRIYLRDAHDHTVQLIDLVEIHRDLTVSLVDLQLSVQSQRMNEIMKVLTIISTIFMPLSFVAGVYGMNFEYMPELTWKYGYAGALAMMGIIAGGLLYFFRRRGWLGRLPREAREPS